MTTRINVGNRVRGYREVGGFNESPAPLTIKPIPKNLTKCNLFLPIGGLAVATISSLIIADLTPIVALAETTSHEVSGIISTNPLDRLFKEIYRVMVKLLIYIDTPVIAWAGYNLALSGTSAEKRSLAKKIIIGVFGGTLLVIGSPWIAHQFEHLGRLMFH
jgi:hypothetical protein